MARTVYNLKHRNTIIATAILIASAILGSEAWYWIQRGGQNSPRVVANESLSSPVSDESKKPNRQTGESSKQSSIPDAAHTESVDRPVTKSRPERLHLELAAVLTSSAEIAQFRALSRKALPTGEERDALREMLADPSLIENARRELLSNDEEVFSKEGEIKRMFRVQYLSSAVEWHDNPSFEEAIEAIYEVVLSENISEDYSEELKRSLAGDKMELFTQLLHSSPEEAQELYEKAKGSNAEALLKYTRDVYEREFAAMRAYENNL